MRFYRHPRCGGMLLFIIFICIQKISWAENQGQDANEMRKEIRVLKESSAEREKKIEELEQRLETLEAHSATTPSSQGLEQAGMPSDIVSKSLGAGTTVRLIDLSLDVLFSAGGSSENDQSLQTLQGGDHDPKKQGFTLGQAELSLAGAVDPYFTGESHIIYKLDALSGDSEFELEEAFLKSQALPWGMQIKAGHYLTEFGRLNPTHPHAWLWMDQPLILTRLFGSDGLRSPGMRLAWLAPVPWYLEVYGGVQNANGETAHSFYANEEVAIGGHPFIDQPVNSPADLLYSTRVVSSIDLTDTVTAQLGLSGLFGPNSTGHDARTTIYGGDLVIKWKPVNHFRGWPFLTFETEAMHRIYEAANFFAAGDSSNFSDDVFIGHELLNDFGFFAQFLYGFYPRFAAGCRYEFANGDNQNAFVRQGDPFRDNRRRVSPLLAFYLSEFSRLRLQYNFDQADHLSESAHSVWGGIEFSFGTHSPHKF